MKGAYLFIEAKDFTAAVIDAFGTEEDYADFQSELASRPDQGDVILGAGPLRKLRWADKRRGMGKRGGLRVIYIHIPDLRILYMLDVYGKDEADDLTKDEKNELKKLATQLIEELRKHERGNHEHQRPTPAVRRAAEEEPGRRHRFCPRPTRAGD